MSPFRNLITRSIGAAPTIQPDFYEEKARVGDLWVLCSDGLTGHVHDEEIVRIATRHSPSEAARQLIELANAHGGRDNITVVVISVRDLLPIPTHAASYEVAEDNGADTTINTASQPVPGMVAFAEAGPGTPLVSGASDADPSSPADRPRAGWRKIFGR